MNGGYDQGPRRPRIVVRETDTYVEHPDDETSPRLPSRWVRDLFQPAIVSALIACVALSTAQFISLVTPLDHTTLFWVAPVLMTLIGFNTQRVLQARLYSRSDHLRFRLVELALLFLIVKVVSHFGNTPAELFEDIRGWTNDPLSFLDTTTMIAFSLGAAAWWAGGVTARDLDAVSDPTAYAGETEPATRLMNRYAYGGAALLILTAFTSVSLTDLIQMEHQRVRNPIVNLLAYFFLGLALLGQVQFARLSGFWHRERVVVAENLGARWLRYTLLFIGLAALIAFALPTGYTVGILDLIATLIYMISYAAMVLYTLILWPILMLLALLTGREPTTERPPPLDTPLSGPPELGGGASGAFWAVARSIVFWVVLMASILYLTRSYLRDHPGLLKTLGRTLKWHRIARAWQAILRWVSNWGRAVTHAVPAAVRRIFGLEGRKLRKATENRRGLKQRNLRERLRRFYLMTLEEAERQGLPRQQEETPYEYHERLGAHLAADKQALTELTEAFVLARYSTREITPEDVAVQKANADRIRRALPHEDVP